MNLPTPWGASRDRFRTWCADVVRRSTLTARAIGVVRDALRCRRGVSALLFAGSSIGLMGAVGLGTEVGSWYLARHHAQNAADAAAIAGALMLNATNNASSAKSAATSAATSNGFTSGSGVTVTPTTPPTSGSYAGNTKAVQVAITQSVRPYFASFFVNSVGIGNKATATLVSVGNACILALNQLTATGSTQAVLSSCALASNGRGSSAVSVGGASTVSASTIVSAGGCSGCSGSNVTLSQRPASSYQPPLLDPTLAVQAVTLPTFSGASCNSVPSGGSPTTLTPYADKNGNITGTVNGQLLGKAYCNGTFKLTNGKSFDFLPGTYFFSNVSWDLQGGTVTCSTCNTSLGEGVTIIFTGSPASSIGSITINGNATITLTAPTVNKWNSAFNGILFYMDKNASDANTSVTINGNSANVMLGGMYFPSLSVSYKGDMGGVGGTVSTCTALVANNITFTGNSSIDISVSGCPSSVVPTIMAAKLVE